METTDLPDDLPPVRPPSIGFIFQLFVVPALIVVAVIAVWLLFGRLAGGEQDWEGLLVGVTSPNHHIRYRSMEGLAQVLDYDRRLGEHSKHLSQNTRIGTVLAEELNKKLGSTSNSDETLKDLMFITRAHGSLDQPELSIPPLLKALQPAVDVDVRKSAVTSLIFIAGRQLEQKTPLTSPELTEGLIEFSKESDPNLRRVAAFALGLLDTPESRNRLLVLQEDADWMTAVNAAIALSRKGTEGYEVLKLVLAGKVDAQANSEDEARVIELDIFRNTFKAVSSLNDAFTDAQRTELSGLIAKLASDHREARVRADAQAALSVLQSSH